MSGNEEKLQSQIAIKLCYQLGDTWHHKRNLEFSNLTSFFVLYGVKIPFDLI